MGGMKDLFGDEPISSNFGTPARELHRAVSPSTSVDAAHAVNTTRLERLVLVAIKSYGQAGCISDDLLRHDFEKYPYSSVTARPSALDRKGFIVRGPDKRKGRSNKFQFVMRVTAQGIEVLE